ncbi:GxxExxY protein [bacterium]|nr:GxxExxY protein [bacterium]
MGTKVPVVDDLLTKLIIGAAIQVHRELGPGLLESAYQKCMEIELSYQGIRFETQVPLDVSYRGVLIGAAYKLDLLVEGQVIVELKAVEKVQPVHLAQILTYLRLMKLSRGLLINFHEATVNESSRVFRRLHLRGECSHGKSKSALQP